MISFPSTITNLDGVFVYIISASPLSLSAHFCVSVQDCVNILIFTFLLLSLVNNLLKVVDKLMSSAGVVEIKTDSSALFKIFVIWLRMFVFPLMVAVLSCLSIKTLPREWVSVSSGMML